MAFITLEDMRVCVVYSMICVHAFVVHSWMQALMLHIIMCVEEGAGGPEADVRCWSGHRTRIQQGQLWQHTHNGN